MQFCTHCGERVQDVSRFCPKCGKPVGDSKARPQISVQAAPSPLKTTASNWTACRYHPQAGVVGSCADCHSGFCAECAIEIVHQGTVCLDCGTQFARKKLIQAYVAVGLGVLAGFAMASEAASAGNWGFAIMAPVIYGYLFGAIFFGWHYGGRIWKLAWGMVQGASGNAGFVGAILLLSLRLMVAMTLGVFGGGIIQFLRYRKMIDYQRSLAVPSQAQAAAG